MSFRTHTVDATGTRTTQAIHDENRSVGVNDKGALLVTAQGDSPLPAAGQGSFYIATPNITLASAYSAGQSIGGKLQLQNVAQVAGGSVFLHHIHLLDRSNTKPSGNLLIFSSDPSLATVTDKTAFSYSTDDSKQVARIPISASDWTTINGKATADLGALGRLVKAAAGSRDLFATFVSDGASVPTFVSQGDLQIHWKFIPNAN